MTRPLTGGEEIAITTHLRIAAGACALSTGLMIGSAGGAIAIADPAPGGASSASQGADAPNNPATPARGPIATFADSVRKAVQNSLQGTVQTVTGALNALPKPGQLPEGIPKPPKTTFGGTPTVYGSTASATTSAPDVATPAAPDAQPASDTNAVVAPATTAPSTPSPATASPVTPDPFAAAANIVAPVTNAFTAVANTVVSAPSVVASLPTSAAPVSDVLTYVQNVLTSVGDAGTSLSQLPTDIAGLLGVDYTVPTSTVGTTTGASRPHTATVPTATAPGWPALPQLLGIPSVAGGPVANPLPAPMTPLDVITTATHVPSDAGSASATPRDDNSNDVLSIVEHVIGAFVATVSLTALAAIALPGIAGLLTTCAAGIRVGYRQAKAASALPDTVVSRFVGSGPVGVVRTGSQVALRSRASHFVGSKSADSAPTRALRVVGSETSKTELLDQAV